MDDETSQYELSEQDFIALLIKFEPAFRAYARSLVPDWDLVDEALQEASVTMWQKRGQLESTDGFLPWARVILRFKCLRQVEKLRSQRSLLRDEVLAVLAERGERRSPDATAARSQSLNDCLRQVSAEHRELLLAPHRSTTSVVKLAEHRGKSPNALYKLLTKLRRQLADCIRLKMTVEG